MKDVLQQADEIPVTLLVAIAYVTMAFLTDLVSPSPEQLHQHGWLMPTLVSDGEPWRLLSSAFLHGGWIHLAFNTYALLNIGPALERSLGSVRMAALYACSALGASLAVCLVNSPFQPVVGGSGALFGMLGAVLALQMRSNRSALGFLDYEGPRRTLTMALLYLVIGAFVPFISNTAHVGGIVTGFAMTFLFLTPAGAIERWMWPWRIASLALVASLLLHSLHPTTRWDWLWRQAKLAATSQRQEQLQIAAAMSFAGQTELASYAILQVNAQMESYETELRDLSSK